MTNNEGLYKWIDLSVLPHRYIQKRGNCIIWKRSVGIPIPFKYKDISGNIIILDVEDDSGYLTIYIDGYTDDKGYRIHHKEIREVALGRVLEEKIITSAPWMIKYLDDTNDAYKYAKNSKAILHVHCPHCGYKKEMSAGSLHNDGFACPVCSDSFSYPNKFMMNILLQLDVDFISEVTCAKQGFEWVGSYRYDFYFELNGHKYFIEMDGHFHNREDVAKNDKIKDELAQQHDVEMIRIDCKYHHRRFEYIKNNIINSRLYKILSLDTHYICWEQCDLFATSNIIYSICDMWNFGINNLTDIAKKYHINNSTVAKYLKQGNDFGLCEYDVKKERMKGLEIGWNKVRETKSKPILVLSDLKTIGVFPSAMELQRQSTQLYGRRFDNSAISSVCNGIYKQAYGYTFKQITKEEYEQYKLQSDIPVY